MVINWLILEAILFSSNGYKWDNDASYTVQWWRLWMDNAARGVGGGGVVSGLEGTRVVLLGA